jgi:nucleotide-binding universal stress UspA family protein
MFKTIVWATDGSPTAALALPYALALAAPHEAKLVVVHAREIMVGRGGGYPVLADESELRATIHQQVQELQSDGIDATYVVRTCTGGHAARTIAEIAATLGADLIVVGTHGYGRVANLFLGSTTQGLIHAGVCPVLAVPTGSAVASPESELAPIATIVTIATT